MIKNYILKVALTSAFLATSLVALFPASLSAESKNIELTLKSPAVGKDLSVQLMVPDKAVPESDKENRGAGNKLIVYLKNLSVPRLGTTADQVLIADFLKRGYLVAVIDYQGNPMGKDGEEVHREYSFLHRNFGAQGCPWSHGAFLGLKWNQDFIPEMVHYKKNVDGRKGYCRFFKVDEKSYYINPARVYVLPEGYTLVDKVELAKIPQQKHPRDRAFMDLLIPSAPQKQVAAMLELSPIANSDMYMCQDTPYPMSYTYHGYAVVLMNNIYEVWRDEKQQNQQYCGKIFAEKKAIRMLRAGKRSGGFPVRLV